MGVAGQVDGLAGALLRCVDEPDRIATIHKLLDRYSHRLRNRLNSIKLSLYLIRLLADGDPGPDWARADAAYRTMEATIDQVQKFCLPISVLPADGELNGWIEGRLGEWRRLLGDRPIRLEADGPGEALPCRVDWVRLGQAIDRLIAAWAAHGPADATIRVSWGRDPDAFRIRFDCEGCAIGPCVEPDYLALPMLARILRAHQGSLSILDDAAGIELSWPADMSGP